MRRNQCVALIALLGAVSCTDAPAALLPPLTDLPADLAAVTLTAEGKPTTPYVMLELRNPTGFSGFVVVNGAGQPVWFFRTRGTASSFTRRRNGDFVFLDGDRGLVEVGRDGQVVRELAQEAKPGRRIHHDVAATPQNTVLFIAEDTRPWNGQNLTGESLWEWNPETGTVTKRWSSFTQLDPATDWSPRSGPADWLHANSLWIGPRGNVLVSFHYLNQVISLAPDFSRIQWRLSGINGTVPVDDPFSGQHTAQEPTADHVLLFDNGYERTTTMYSRAVEFELRNGTGRKVWEWRPARDNWARIISGVRRLSNGNSMVTFGTSRGYVEGATGPIEVYEVTHAGAVVWHLTVAGPVASMYRATPLQDL